MKLIFHIGLSKCGSTTIQDYIHGNKQELKKEGLLIPNTGTIRFPTRHFDFFRFEGEEYKSLCENLVTEAEKSGCHTVVLSEESINKGDPDKHAILKQSFDNVKIVIYLRRQDLLLESYYNQQIKVPWVYERSFAKPRSLINYSQTIKWLDYNALLEKYASIFGIENIVVIPFERKQLPNDLGLHFVEKICKIKTKNIKLKTPMSVLNTSVPYSSLGLLSSINRIDMGLLGQQGPVRDLIHNIVRDNFKDQSSKVLILKDRKALMAKFEEGNRKVANNYLGRKDGKLFYDPLPDDNSQVQNLTNLDMASATTMFIVPLLREIKSDLEELESYRRKKRILTSVFPNSNSESNQASLALPKKNMIYRILKKLLGK